jgi:L-seryl-tRNA(Ser) seleniumtransferase
VRSALGGIAEVAVAPCASQVGSGALPVETLPSFALSLRSARASAESLARRFRGLPVPVIGRIHSEALLLDVRCLVDETTFVKQLDRLTDD